MLPLSRRCQLRLQLRDLAELLGLGTNIALVVSNETGELGLTHTPDPRDVVVVTTRDFDTTTGRPALGRTPTQLDALAGYLDGALLAEEVNPDHKVFLPVSADHMVYAK